MKDEIYQSIKLLLQNDITVATEQRQHILKACRQKLGKNNRRLGTVNQAAEILSCHPKTVYRYVRRGILHPLHYSLRKVRFDLDEVETFETNGLPKA